MGRITEAMVRSRSEHNELQISTLEEISLHQQDIEKIEYIDKWCKDLKILYLQSNLISRIENVSRLKNLHYLNLALNSVECIEGLEGCESLKKLDLTVNFVGKLTSVDSLKHLPHFNELYLTGNPCTEFKGYRRYVIATLPHLRKLDGTNIERSERIESGQNYDKLRDEILIQEQQYLKTRADEKFNSSKVIKDADNDEFWKQESKYTPESRAEVHKHIEQQKTKDKKVEEPKKVRKLLTDDGRALNVNEAKVDFHLLEDEDNNCYVLDVSVFRHLHTSLIDIDIQPSYVRVIIKGKTFQLSLQEEVSTDQSTAQRSQTTGHLVITMPWVKQILKPKSLKKTLPKQTPLMTTEVSKSPDSNTELNNRVERLEVDPSVGSHVDLDVMKQTKDPQRQTPQREPEPTDIVENSPGFIDDLDVPPLI